MASILSSEFLGRAKVRELSEAKPGYVEVKEWRVSRLSDGSTISRVTPVMMQPSPMTPMCDVYRRTCSSCEARCQHNPKLSNNLSISFRNFFMNYS